MHARQLAAYLDRIGFRGVPRADVETLRAMCRAHVHTVPFENLDVQLHRPVGLDLDASFDKVVDRRRGGWCFELNGLLGRALQEVGFDVIRLSAGVRREHLGDAQMGNHLCLLVRLERSYLVDVGFGGTLTQPLLLEAAVHHQAPYHVALKELSDDQWRFSEWANDEPFSFDFRIATADEARFAEKNVLLQTNPDSPFVQNLVALRRLGDSHLALQGRVLTTLRPTGMVRATLGSADELVATLRDLFDLDVPEASTLWPAICARHELMDKRRAPA